MLIYYSTIIPTGMYLLAMFFRLEQRHTFCQGSRKYRWTDRYRRSGTKIAGKNRRTNFVYYSTAQRIRCLEKQKRIN
jgi:hypothetical protein